MLFKIYLKVYEFVYCVLSLLKKLHEGDNKAPPHCRRDTQDFTFSLFCTIVSQVKHSFVSHRLYSKKCIVRVYSRFFFPVYASAGVRGHFAFSTFVAVCVARCRFISDHASITPRLFEVTHCEA